MKPDLTRMSKDKSILSDSLIWAALGIHVHLLSPLMESEDLFCPVGGLPTAPPPQPLDAAVPLSLENEGALCHWQPSGRFIKISAIEKWMRPWLVQRVAHGGLSTPGYNEAIRMYSYLWVNPAAHWQTSFHPTKSDLTGNTRLKRGVKCFHQTRAGSEGSLKYCGTRSQSPHKLARFPSFSSRKHGKCGLG